MSDPVDAAVASMIRNLEEKSGATLAVWIERARASGAKKHGEIVTWLKTQHKLGHGYANLIALRLKEAQEGGPTDDEALIVAQYPGAKAATRPILDAILKAVKGFGTSLEISPKKTCVSLRRKKQFALVQPGTATRVDLGLVLKGVAPTGRLEAAGSFNAMVTHRVKLGSVKEVDSEVVGWLREAWEAAQ